MFYSRHPKRKKNELIRILVSDDTNSPCLLCTYYRVTFRELLRACPLLQELFREGGGSG